ncbi:MAG: immunoglobulin domain-containing protein, partial [Limisphaerales bacterium]
FVYQWFFNGAPLVNDRAFGAQSNILTIASALRGDAGSYFVVVSNNYGTLTSDVVSLAVTAPDVLWNVDFGSGSTSLKTGPAAIGQTASDFWNSYGFNRAGVTNLLLADGTPSAVTVKVYGQGPVAPVNGNPDPMYHDYLYQYNLPGNLTVDTTNLPPGSFDFYYYAGCGDYNYQLYVNGVSQGQWQVWGSGSGSTNWQEGVHYAAFRGVTLTNYTSSVRVVITYLDSVCLEAVISGMQIAEATTAPLFVLQPTNTAVVSGFDATFTAGAIGSPQPVSYQWLFNGTPLTNSAHIAGANSYSLSIFAAQTNDIGSYQLLASTSSNSALSDVAMLWVQSLPPSFTLLPVGQVVAPGSNFVLSVKAVGSIPISYQWFSNGLAMVDDGRIVGATSTNLSFSPAQTNDSASYYVVASNPVNATTSSVANIFVGVAAKISQQPTSQTNIVGTIANFSATVDGTQPLTYSWLFNGAPLSDSARIFGSATSSLSISNVQVTDGGTYVLVAGNGAGTVTSSSVILTVLPPPTISPQPIGRSLPLGLPTTFSVSATGPAPITYQWQINGANIPGATSTAYAISNVSLADLGTYNLVASNVAGVTVSSNAVLTLGPVACWGRNNANQCLPPPGLTNVVGIGGAANYSAGLKSDGTISAWGANFSLLPMSNVVAVSLGSVDQGHALFADGTFTGWGGAGVSPGITNVIAIADGNGNSLFLRSDGTVAAIPAGYTPLGLTKIVAIAAGAGNQNLALRSDGTVLEWGISLAGAGTTAITNPVPGLSNVVAIATGYSHCLALKSDGRVVTWGGRNAGLNLPPLLTNAAAPGVVAIAASGYPQGQGHSLAVLTNGTVIAWGDNPYGETNVPSGLTNVVAVAGGAYHSVALVNDGRPLILQSPVGGTAFTGRGFNFKAQVVGDAPLVYQWTFNGTNLPGATNALLTLTNVQGTNAGSYQLLVSNSIGNASSVPLPVKVVNSGPFLSTQPRSQTVCVGTRVGWSVPVGGSGPMYLHWRIATNAPQQPLGWRDLPGATNEDLVFDPVQVSDTGIYSLLASNALGSVTTTNVSLTVQQVVAWGDGGRTNVPANLTNVIAVSGGSSLYSYALRDDGTVAQWAYVSTNYSLPNFSNVVEISAGDTTSRAYALRSDGTVVGWNVSSAISNVLARLSGIVALESDAGGSTHLHPDGTITR